MSILGIKPNWKQTSNQKQIGYKVTVYQAVTTTVIAVAANSYDLFRGINFL